MTKPKVYITNHPLSQTVGKAVLAGTRGQAVSPPELQDGPAICYGILRGCGDVIRKAYNSLHDFYHIDHGYMRRVDWGDSSSLAYGYFRVSKNALSLFGAPTEFPYGDRFEKLGIELAPLQQGKNIVVCALTDLWCANHPWVKVDGEEWLVNTVKNVRSVTDRPIVIKDKKSGRLSDLLEDAHCVICHSSNAAIESLVRGVPVLTTGESIATYGPLSFSTLENSIDEKNFNYYRMFTLRWAANNQFTLQELSQEETWDKLLGEATWNGHKARNLI